ncbi:MAG: GNAT family N-acetyltransferase, partial [Solirubrobacteraceae bacterium]
SLPFIVASTQIGLTLDLLTPATAAGLVAAGLLSVLLYPLLSLTLLGGQTEPPVTVVPFTGPRQQLRELFDLAEGATKQLDSYVHAGEILVARAGEQIVGHIQLTETDAAGELEVKNMAVLAEQQGRGVGRMLLAAGRDRAAEQGRRSLIVATGAAEVDNLRFYQRVGFRFSRVERDVFTPAQGYPAKIVVDGIQLRDRVWLTVEL